MTSAIETTATFSAWMAEHGVIIDKVARTYARAERERLDLARELTFQVWLSVPKFGGAARPATWIYRVCLNTALTWRRNAGRQARRSAGATEVGDLPAPAPGPAAQAERSDLLATIFGALHQVAELDRSLILLQLDGFSYRDMAEITGLTENHIGVALTRARRNLTAQLKGVIDELE